MYVLQNRRRNHSIHSHTYIVKYVALKSCNLFIFTFATYNNKNTAILTLKELSTTTNSFIKVLRLKLKLGRYFDGMRRLILLYQSSFRLVTYNISSPKTICCCDFIFGFLYKTYKFIFRQQVHKNLYFQLESLYYIHSVIKHCQKKNLNQLIRL